MPLFWWIVVGWLVIGLAYLPVGLQSGRMQMHNVISLLMLTGMLAVMGPVIWLAAARELYLQKVKGKSKACPIQLKDPE